MKGTKLKRYIALGGDWDEFSARYNNDTTAVTVSSNGAAKNYGVHGSSLVNGNDPLANYLALVTKLGVKGLKTFRARIDRPYRFKNFYSQYSSGWEPPLVPVELRPLPLAKSQWQGGVLKQEASPFRVG